MDATPPSDLFVPVLAWPGRRPTLPELTTWHEALRGAVANVLPIDLLACWLYPSRGGSVLLGPKALHADKIEPPPAEPLVAQEGLFALEDRITAGGYGAAMAIPIRAEVQDVGLLLVASFSADSYTLASQRALHRIAAQLATTFRRLASHPWVAPHPQLEERIARTASVSEGLLEVIGRARNGAELVQLSSDVLSNQLPHDRLELIAAAPAPERWTMLSQDRSGGVPVPLAAEAADAIDALVHHFGPRDVVRVIDLDDIEGAWPATSDRRSAERLHAVLAARMEVGGEFVGWLLFANEVHDWFTDEDANTADLAARLLASRVAAWEARAELAGALG